MSPTQAPVARKGILARFAPDIHERIAKLAEENKRSYGNQVAFMVEQQLAEDAAK